MLMYFSLIRIKRNPFFNYVRRDRCKSQKSRLLRKLNAQFTAVNE